MKSTLTVAGGPQDGQALELDEGALGTLGAAPSASLHVPQGNVAPQHAKVEMDPVRGLLISDLGSATGTYVNGEKVSGEQALADGDRICLGPPGSRQSVKLIVKLGVADSPPTASEEPAIILDSLGDESPAIILDDPGTPGPTALEPVPKPMRPAPPPAAVPPPAAAPPPAAPEASPPRPTPPPAATPPPPPVAEVRKPAKPEYTSDIPSMFTAPKDSGPLPIAPPLPENLKLKGKALPKKAGPSPARLAIAVSAGVLISAVLFFGVRSFAHKTPPVLTSVLPPKVEGGQTVTIAGSDFGSDGAALTVRFGKDTGTVISASETQVAVTLPEISPETGSAQVSVTVESRGGRSNALFLTVAAIPRITSLSPDVAQPGDSVAAAGKNLGGKPLAVTVAGQAAEVLEATPQSLRFRVPDVAVAPGHAAPVVVQVGRETSKPANLFLGRLPLLIELSPLRAMAGDRVTLRGRGFDPAALVSFEGERALVFSASDSELVVAAPAPPGYASQADVRVIVEAHGSRSNPLTAILTRLSSGYFTPRYYPTPIADHPEHALVSTDLGPVLALGAKAEAASTAERAAKVASALNQVVADAASKAVTIEVRERPALGVAVAGAPSLLVSVTADDLAAYQDFDATLKSRHVPLVLLADYWAALVQDQLDLFVRRERPARLLELSTRGRALSQIYAEALRRAGEGGGVPLGVVSPLSSTLARDLREMALLLPAEGQSIAAAAVEGRWDGTLWEEGAGDRPITVRLKLAGARLSGTLTTHVGGIFVDLPLQDVVYEKGTLRFVAVLGGVKQRFEGRVAGEEVDGSLLPAAGGAARGRFSLKFTG